MNKIETFENLEHLTHLEEVWLNWNFFADTVGNRDYLKKLQLRTIYLADNPISNHNGYEQMLKGAIPSLQ